MYWYSKFNVCAALIAVAYAVCGGLRVCMCHFAWADQRDKQGYKSDVSLNKGKQNKLYPGKIKLIQTCK